MKKIKIELSDLGYDMLKDANETYKRQTNTKQTIDQTASELIAVALLIRTANALTTPYQTNTTGQKNEETNKN